MFPNLKAENKSNGEHCLKIITLSQKMTQSNKSGLNFELADKNVLLTKRKSDSTFMKWLKRYFRRKSLQCIVVDVSVQKRSRKKSNFKKKRNGDHKISERKRKS